MTLKIQSTAIAVSALLAATNIYAQEAAPTQQVAPTQQAAPAAQNETQNIDQQTLDQFTKAYSAVMSIQQHFSAQLNSATDEQKAQAVHEKAQEKMIEAVEESGLSVKEYGEIIAMLERDPKLRQQIFGGQGSAR
jgi:formamidopyrimidine-DNA glycosylase